MSDIEQEVLIEAASDASSIQIIDRKIKNKLLTIAILSCLFMIIEIIGGFISNSLAVLTDAAHMMADVSSFIISYLAIVIKRKKPTKNFPFGFHRAEVLGAFISIITIYVVTCILVYEAVSRIISNEFHIDSDTMLIVSGAGVAFNIIMFIVLNACSCSAPHHHHGHSHSVSDNLNIRAALIHVVGDLAQSFGVLISAYVIRYTDFKLVDPVCTLVFAVIVLCSSCFVLRDITYVLMEGNSRSQLRSEIIESVSKCIEVQHVVDLFIWHLSSSTFAINIRIVPAMDVASELAKNVVRSRLQEFGIFEHIFIDVSAELGDHLIDS